MSSRKQFKREFFKVARWVHVYVSTTLFSLLVFFAVTGITLNHKWYDPDGSQESMVNEPLSQQQLSAWGLGANWQPKVDAMTQYFAEFYALTLPSSIDIDSELREVFFEYQVPAGFASVIVSADTQALVIEQEQGSLLAILNDLHKGRHSGQTWFWLIDISAILMVLFSLTGVIILFHGRKYRTGGSWATIMGLVTPVALFLLFVPRVII